MASTFWRNAVIGARSWKFGLEGAIPAGLVGVSLIPEPRERPANITPPWRHYSGRQGCVAKRRIRGIWAIPPQSAGVPPPDQSIGSRHVGKFRSDAGQAGGDPRGCQQPLDRLGPRQG